MVPTTYTPVRRSGTLEAVMMVAMSGGSGRKTVAIYFASRQAPQDARGGLPQIAHGAGPFADRDPAEAWARDILAGPGHPGYLVSVQVDAEWISQFPLNVVGSGDDQIGQYLLTAVGRDELGEHIVGSIELLGVF